MEWILVGIAVLGLLAMAVFIVRKERAAKNAQREHRPHSPGSGNDPKAVARSFGLGQDGGGMNGG